MTHPSSPSKSQPNKPAAPLVYLLTLGCPKNEADSRTMVRSFLDQGYGMTKNAEEADVIVINSCTFIEDANTSTIESILDAAEIKRKKNAKLVVAGCFAQRYPDVFKEELPEVDYHFGTGQYHKAGELIAQGLGLAGVSGQAVAPDADAFVRAEKPYSFFKLADGCNRGCTFCVIPHIRGKFTPTPEADIISGVRGLFDSGVREVGLVSQDTCRVPDLTGLLQKLDELALSYGDEKRWLRLYYLYPDKTTGQILSVWPKLQRLAPYLDMPVQHVSRSILKKMNRSGEGGYYSDLIAKFREVCPAGEVRTSFILGFPEETEADVDMLSDFIHTARPEKLALFLFSPQEHTPGSGLSIYPDENTATERRNRLASEHDLMVEEHYIKKIGDTAVVLVDGLDTDGWFGHRICDAPDIDPAIRLNGDAFAAGQTIQVELTDYFSQEWTGTKI